VAVLALVFYANLGAVDGPEENLEDLHIALINKDRGGDLAGKEVKLSDSLFRDVIARRERKEGGKGAETAESRTLAHRLSFAARKFLRVAVSFCKGHT
jgi:hypothetical protein